MSPGESVVFEAGFADGSAETFPVLNPSGDALVDQTESLYMSWFATSGSFEHDRTGVAGTEVATSTSNTWKAPDDGNDQSICGLCCAIHAAALTSSRTRFR